MEGGGEGKWGVVLDRHQGRRHVSDHQNHERRGEFVQIVCFGCAIKGFVLIGPQVGCFVGDLDQ